MSHKTNLFCDSAGDNFSLATACQCQCLKNPSHELSSHL